VDHAQLLAEELGLSGLKSARIRVPLRRWVPSKSRQGQIDQVVATVRDVVGVAAMTDVGRPKAPTDDRVQTLAGNAADEAVGLALRLGKRAQLGVRLGA
jgi:hypothetical protein